MGAVGGTGGGGEVRGVVGGGGGERDRHAETVSQTDIEAEFLDFNVPSTALGHLRQREADRQTERDRERQRQRERETETERKRKKQSDRKTEKRAT